MSQCSALKVHLRRLLERLCYILYINRAVLRGCVPYAPVWFELAQVYLGHRATPVFRLLAVADLL